MGTQVKGSTVSRLDNWLDLNLPGISIKFSLDGLLCQVVISNNESSRKKFFKKIEDTRTKITSQVRESE